MRLPHRLQGQKVKSQGAAMRPHLLFKMPDAAAQYYLYLLMLLPIQKVKDYQQTKLCRHISIHGWNVTTSVFDKQTSAILELYFRFPSRPLRHNLHVVLHQDTEFHPNRSTRCENMTSYPFLKMAAATAKYNFRFHICWYHCLQKAKVYQQTKFRGHISIQGWDITTSGLKKQTSAILEFYLRFRSRPFFRNRRVILHPATEFRQNRYTCCGNMTLYQFSRWRPSAMLYFLWEWRTTHKVPFRVWTRFSNR